MLDTLKTMVPYGRSILVNAVGFYGTAALIGWSQKTSWDYRIRLKTNLTLRHQGADIFSDDIVCFAPQGIQIAELYGSGIITNIGVL